MQVHVHFTRADATSLAGPFERSDVSILDDACRIGRFAVIDARYGHFQDRFHPAIDLDAPEPDRDLWCVFARRDVNAAWSPSRAGTAKIVDVVPVAPRRHSTMSEDAVFLRAPFWIPVADVVRESYRQQTQLPNEVGLAIVRAVVDSLVEGLPAPARAPRVAEESVGLAVDGRVLFFGWRPGIGYPDDGDDDNALRRSWGRVADIAARVLHEPQQAFVVDRIRGHDVMTSSAPPAWDRDRFVELHRSLDGIGGIEEAAPTWIAELVANLFPARIAERRELEEELAACAPAALRALPPPKA